MADKLKPCPFCGSSDLELYAEVTEVDDDRWESHILCNHCRAYIGEFVWYESKEEAEAEIVKLWNRREN